MVLAGVWGVGGELGIEEEGEVPMQATISYLSSIKPAPDLIYVPEPGGEVAQLLENELGAVAFAVEPATGQPAAETTAGPGNTVTAGQLSTVCGSGSIASPDAEPGNLCVFVESEEGVRPAELLEVLASGGSTLWKSPSAENGAVVSFALKEPAILEFESTAGYAKGSWAVSTKAPGP